VRISTVRLAFLLAAAAAGAIAAGAAHAAEGQTAAPTTTAAAPATTAATATTAAAAPTTAAGAPTTTAAAAPATTAAAAPTTVAGATTTVAAAAGLLPANAPLEQIQAAVAGAFGPTTDVVAELAPFVPTYPAGIPTPEGTVLEEINVFYYPDRDDPSFSYYSSTILFTSATPAPDLVTLFQTAMPAAGFVQTGDSVQNDDGRQVRFLTYDVPTPVSDQDEVRIGIVDETSTTQVDFVQLEIQYGLDPAVVDIYTAWPGALPLISGVPIDDVTMSTFNFGGDISLSLSNRYTIPLAPTDAFAQFEAGLEGTGYTVDPDSDPTEGWFDILGGPLGEATIYLNEGYPEGSSYLSIDTSFDIVA
jgi:hypothetical protein